MGESRDIDCTKQAARTLWQKCKQHFPTHLSKQWENIEVLQRRSWHWVQKLYLVTEEGEEKEASFHGNAGAERKRSKYASSQGRIGAWKMKTQGEGQSSFHRASLCWISVLCRAVTWSRAACRFWEIQHSLGMHCHRLKHHFAWESITVSALNMISILNL